MSQRILELSAALVLTLGAVALLRGLSPPRLQDLASRKQRLEPAQSGLVESTDGRWTLLAGMDRTSRCTATEVGTKRQVRRQLHDGAFWACASNKVWLPDNRSWVGLLAKRDSVYAVVQGLDHPEPAKEVALGYPSGTTQGWELVGARLLGTDRAGRVTAIVEGDGERQRRVRFFQFGLQASHDVQEYEVALPPRTVFRDVALAPDGTKLAWLLGKLDVRGHRLEQILLATSDGKGHGWRILAAESVGRPLSALSELDLPYNLRWTTGGLSFERAGYRWVAVLPGSSN